MANDEDTSFADPPRSAEGRRKEAMAEQNGWLIESNSPQGVPQYWDGRENHSFTTDAHDAVRFARFEDAERVRAWMLLKAIREHCRSVEHMWSMEKSNV
jgi:hypothetical protein